MLSNVALEILTLDIASGNGIYDIKFLRIVRYFCVIFVIILIQYRITEIRKQFALNGMDWNTGQIGSRPISSSFLKKLRYAKYFATGSI